MNVNSITPKPEENINIIKALEYLAFGWEPFVDDDEYIADPNRIGKRTDNYFLTNKKMIAATAKLSNFIRNQKIGINSCLITPMFDDFYHTIESSIHVKITDNMLYNDPLLDYNTLKKQKIKKVLTRYIKFEEGINVPSILKFDVSSLVRSSNGNAYLPVLFISTDDSLLICADSKEFIKFSELKTLMSSKKKGGRHPKTTDDAVVRCYLEHLEEFHPEYKEDRPQKGSIYRKICGILNEGRSEESCLEYSTVESKLNKFIDILWDKHVKITNQK
jgi:hypothetical protein